MRAPRAQAGIVCLLLVLTLLPPTAAGAEPLTVDAPGWQVVQTARNGSVSPQLFMTPGDVNGDGFDDLLVWRGYNGSSWGYALFNGSATGIDPAEPWDPHSSGGLPDGMHDTATPLAADTRPTGIDANGDGRDDVAGWYRAGNTCNEIPEGGPGRPCGFAVQNYSVLAYGNRLRGLTTHDMAKMPQSLRQMVPTTVYLVPPTRPGDQPSVLGESVYPRDEPNGEAARTEFTLYRLNGSYFHQGATSWSVPEANPPTDPPRVPRFLAAPDFDGDGLADIVTWVPPTVVANTGYPGELTIYNGSRDGPQTENPYRVLLNASNVVVADFDGDGHPDIAFSAYPGVAVDSPGNAPLVLEVRLWNPRSLFSHEGGISVLGGVIYDTTDSRWQAGDIDRNGRADIVVIGYGSTGQGEAEILVDGFLNPSWCESGPGVSCMVAAAAPSFSRRIGITGPIPGASPDELRVNLQSDYDGDGRLDITVGYYESNSTPNSPDSGFVAVLLSAQALRDQYRIWIDTDTGGIVLPEYRNYTIHVQGWLTIADTSTLRINLTNFGRPLWVDIQQSGSVATSSSPADLAIDGPSSIMHGDGADGAYWFASIPVRFNGSLPHNTLFGLEARWVGSHLDERAVHPRAALYAPTVHIEGPLYAESEGRAVADGDWVRAGARVNFTGLRLVYDSLPSAVVPTAGSTWVVRVAGLQVGVWSVSSPAVAITAPSVTQRDLRITFEVEGAIGPYVADPKQFTVGVDADPPTFGAPLPAEDEWITSSPAFVAAQVFDNQSGVDPARIEYSWEYDGAPFVRWYPAAALPGQTASEVVAQALVDLPEGDLSNIVWRAWDRVGNGPGESRIYRLLVDTQDLTFSDPYPDPNTWIGDPAIRPAIWIHTGPSSLNLRSLEYRASYEGLFGFGPWTPQCPRNDPVTGDPIGVCRFVLGQNPDGSINITATRGYPAGAVTFAEGDQNWVQWRASNNASDELYVSDPFQVRLDSKAPVIELVLPGADTILPLVPVNLVVSAHEGSPPGVAQRGLDLTEGGATYRVRGPDDPDFGPWQPLSVTSSTPDAWSAEFGATLDLARGSSVVEVSVREVGGQAGTAQTTVRVNQHPSVMIVSDPDGFVVQVNGTLRLIANGQDDGDLALAYRWSLCEEGAPPISQDQTVTLSATGRDELRTDRERDIVLCLTVLDGLDGFTTQNVTVMVREPVPGDDPTERPGAPATIPVGADFLVLVLVMAALATAAFMLVRRRARPPEEAGHGSSRD